MTATIQTHIQQLIGKELGADPDRVPVAARVVDLGLSSLQVLRIVAAVERTYGIELEDHDIFQVETVADLTRLVAVRVGDPVR
jgi:acyl carrier protein